MAPHSVARRCAWLALAALLACKEEPPPAPPPVRVEVAAVEQRDAAVSIELVGSVRGSQEVDVRPRVGGVVVAPRASELIFGNWGPCA